MNKRFNHPGQWKAYLAVAWYAFKAQTRNPATFAFGFIFPVVFISIFGLIGSSQPKISLGILDTQEKTHPVVAAFTKQPYIAVISDTQENLTTKIKTGKLAGTLEVEEKGSANNAVIHLTLSQAMPQETGILRAIAASIVSESNLKIAGITNPALALSFDEVAGQKQRYIDFALPGQIGFSLLSTAIFGTVFGLIYLKKALILKRMFATPTKALTILLAQATSRLFIALLQTLLILVIGVLVFQFYLPHGIQTLAELILISIIGLIAFLGFGYFMAGLSNDENSAGPLVNLVTLPQFLLSGTFFATDNLPMWLQPVANNLPLSYFNIAVRKVTTEGGSLPDTFPYLLGLIIWGAVMYLLAAKTFKWQ